MKIKFAFIVVLSSLSMVVNSAGLGQQSSQIDTGVRPQTTSKASTNQQKYIPEPYQSSDTTGETSSSSGHTSGGTGSGHRKTCIKWNFNDPSNCLEWLNLY